jgi:uncharacterized RDD family membrane protein YckC
MVECVERFEPGHASVWQATFGKRLMNIRVAGRDGQRLGQLI